MVGLRVVPQEMRNLIMETARIESLWGYMFHIYDCEAA